MAVIRPFCGLRYGSSVALDDVLSPPYDIISPQEQEALHERSPYNVIRLELGQPRPGDSESSNRYTRARVLLESWVGAGVLQAEDEPVFYLCRHEFRHAGRRYGRWELMARLRLEEWDAGVVLPHEHTLPEPKADRMNLLRATRTNISPVYVLYDDEGGIGAIIDDQVKDLPAAEVHGWRDDEGFTVWLIRDSAAIERISALLADKPLYVADGHHRYETALAYRNEQRRAQPEAPADAPFNYVMVSMTNIHDSGLLILPIHRLIKHASPEQMAGLREGIAAEWHVRRVSAPGLVGGRGLQEAAAIDAELNDRTEGPAFGIYGLEPETLWVITPRDEAPLRGRVSPMLAEPLRQLDLSLLHAVLIHGYLHIGTTPAEVEAALSFTHDAAEAMDAVDAERFRLAVLVKPTRLEQLVAVANVHEKMPQKSTFFYPKLPTGLVLNPLDGSLYP